MIRDLTLQMRRLLVERTGHDYVSVTHAHLTELVDRCEAAEAFGAACIEFTEADSWAAWHGDPRLVAAREAHSLAVARFFALCIPKEVTPDA